VADEQNQPPNVRLNFDISHFDIIGIGIDDCVPSIVPWSVHTHVKDQRGNLPPISYSLPWLRAVRFRYITWQPCTRPAIPVYIGMEVSVMVQRKPGYDPLVDAALGLLCPFATPLMNLGRRWTASDDR